MTSRASRPRVTSSCSTACRPRRMMSVPQTIPRSTSAIYVRHVTSHHVTSPPRIFPRSTSAGDVSWSLRAAPSPDVPVAAPRPPLQSAPGRHSGDFRCNQPNAPVLTSGSLPRVPRVLAASPSLPELLSESRRRARGRRSRECSPGARPAWPWPRCGQSPRGVRGLRSRGSYPLCVRAGVPTSSPPYLHFLLSIVIVILFY